MDMHRFDALARSLASGTTRRAFIRNLTRSGAGALAGIGIVRSTQAARQPTGSGSGTTGQNTCDEVECPPGRVFSETACACVCDLVCRPNFRLDQATCNCYCTLGDFYVCPRPDQVYDDNACECVCANEDCPGDAELNPDTCECFCPSTITCGPGEQIDPTTCECYCDRVCEFPKVLDDCECVCGIGECDPGFIFDETACTCTCERDCQAPLTLDPDTCACICQASTACVAPKVFDEKVCDCICDPNIRCTRGKVVDPETCGCICPLEDPCPTGLKMNPESCLCECSGPVVCTAPKVQDPEACACICPQDVACPAQQTLDPETCVCVCPVGMGLCQDRCVDLCPPTQAFNAACVCEPIVCPPDRVLTCTCACPQGMAECDGNCLPACGPKQVFDAACRCACRPNISCPDGYVLDPVTCECVCDTTTTCPTGKELDKRTCTCVCPPNQSCLVGQTLNPETCICECGPEPCPPGRVKNRLCRCICPPNVRCRPGETRDPETCACRCAPGSLLETIRVPCGGRTVTSTTVLQAGVAYTMRASGTCVLGANNSGDAEYAFQTIDDTNLTHLQDICINNGTELGIGINDPTIDGAKNPDWGAYTTTHVYTTIFTGLGATINLNYHDCFFNDNQGELTVEIFCPGTPTGDPVGTGTGTGTPICTNTCPTGKTLDPQTCACVCPAAECAAPFQRDPVTCGCICPPNISCQQGESVDPKTCKCRCNPGATLETVTVPCSGAPVLSTTSLQAGVTYVLRASGTCTIGYISPPAPDADAEYAFVHSDPTNTGLIMDRCPGASDLGIGIDDATFDGTKTPNWGTYSPTHVYTIGFVGKGAPISVNYHDCVHRDNIGSLQVEIICPGASSGEPTDTGEDSAGGD